MSDYKYEIQMIAEEIAEDEYGKDYHSLTDELQCAVYSRAMETWSERRVNACI
jgi:hypothetical protein